MTSKKTVRIACSHEGCNEQIIYEPEEVLVSIARKNTEVPSNVIVYLKCPKGHIGRYMIQKEGIKE